MTPPDPSTPTGSIDPLAPTLDPSPWARAAASARAGSGARPIDVATRDTGAAGSLEVTDTARSFEAIAAARSTEATGITAVAEFPGHLPLEPMPPPRGPQLRKPTWRFMLAHPAHVFGLGFGSGLSRWAPGTAGTLWAWIVFRLLQPHLNDTAWGVLIAASLVAGWWACTVTARDMNVADPGSIVWDEVVAFWIVLWLIGPGTLWAEAVAFALFRFFDAAKPGPVAWADALFKGKRGKPIGWAQGFGILFDDLVAALCTLIVIAIWRMW